MRAARTECRGEMGKWSSTGTLQGDAAAITNQNGEAAMVDELQLFRGRDFKVNDFLSVHHATLNEICEYGETDYFNLVGTLCATPSDYKLPLWDQFGIDWEQIDELVFFSVICNTLPAKKTRILLGDFPLSRLRPKSVRQGGELTLYDSKSGARLDRASYSLMTEYLRRVHGLSKRIDRSGNAAAKRYLLDKERRASNRRHGSEPARSILVPLISAMVNCEQFKYDHKSVWDLPVYTFMDSVKRIQRLKSYDQAMTAAYTGMVDLSKLPKEQFDWLGNLD